MMNLRAISVWLEKNNRCENNNSSNSQTFYGSANFMLEAVSFCNHNYLQRELKH